VKDVDVRNDLLKKFGIPLDLAKGKVEQIKVTVNTTKKLNIYYNNNLTRYEVLALLNQSVLKFLE